MIRPIFLFLCCLLYASAGVAGEKNKQLLKVEKEIKSVSSQLSLLKKQENKALHKLKNIEQQYGKISHSVRSLGKQLKQKKQRINEVQQEIKVQKRWLAAQESYLEGQVKAAYVLGRQEPLKLLLSQEDIAKSSRMMRYYLYFNRDRINQVQQINSSLQLLQGLEKEKQAELIQVSELATEQKNKQKSLVQTKQARKKLLKAIKKDFKAQNYQLSKLKKNASKLKGLVNALRAEARRPVAEIKAGLPFNKLKGKMQWPVKKKIIKYFGNKRLGGQWDGVLMRAAEGTKVKAIAAGQVVFAEWFKGYGLLVIVQHDKNYMSLYAYNQSLYQTKGDWISAGDTLATVGKSGGRERAALYFEIRKKNKPVNPAKWCR